MGIPASCTIESSNITTFDNLTYSYLPNNCEHVVAMDGSKTYPIAVLIRNLNTQTMEKEIKVLSGEFIVEFLPKSDLLEVLINKERVLVHPGQTYNKTSPLGTVLLELIHYEDGVYQLYIRNQNLEVITDGRRLEVIAPQLIGTNAIGLCGDLNGELSAELVTPRRCLTSQAKYTGFSYMLNNRGSNTGSVGPTCSGIPTVERTQFERELSRCIKKEVIPTPLSSIVGPVLSTSGNSLQAITSSGSSLTLIHPVHLVERDYHNQLICISKIRIKACSENEKPNLIHPKRVKFVCLSKHDSFAKNLVARAESGENLVDFLRNCPSDHTTLVREAIHCIPKVDFEKEDIPTPLSSIDGPVLSSSRNSIPSSYPVHMVEHNVQDGIEMTCISKRRIIICKHNEEPVDPSQTELPFYCRDSRLNIAKSLEKQALAGVNLMGILKNLQTNFKKTELEPASCRDKQNPHNQQSTIDNQYQAYPDCDNDSDCIRWHGKGWHCVFDMSTYWSRHICLPK